MSTSGEDPHWIVKRYVLIKQTSICGINQTSTDDHDNMFNVFIWSAKLGCELNSLAKAKLYIPNNGTCTSIYFEEKRFLVGLIRVYCYENCVDHAPYIYIIPYSRSLCLLETYNKNACIHFLYNQAYEIFLNKFVVCASSTYTFPHHRQIRL
jgi:hypothetical protein